MVVAPNLNTTSSSNDSILVKWLPVQNAVFYTLCIIQEGSNIRVKLNTTDTTVTFDNLSAGATYCIKGTAWDSQGRTGDDYTVCQITRKNNNIYYEEVKKTYTENPNWSKCFLLFLFHSQVLQAQMW